MNKTAYLLGLSYMALCGLAVARSRFESSLSPAPDIPATREPVIHAVPADPQVAEQPLGDGRGWFAGVKPFCNTLEVETALAHQRPPAGTEGVGFEAACWALAGKIDRARPLLAALSSTEQVQAAAIVFDVAHPVADAGDDRSAGPIMALVVEFWPNHYMALYHAGISEYSLGDHDRARTHLEAFLASYSAEDGWRASARHALEKMSR